MSRSSNNLYCRYVDSNALILPLEEIERIIASADHFFVDPCDCRLEYGRCDSPLYTCMRIGFGAQVRQETTGRKGLAREDALRVARNAHAHGLIFCLEQCIQPYQFNICMCCSCCCIQYQFRYRFGHRALESGPYLPRLDAAACTACAACADRCPPHALSLNAGRPLLASKDCLGCGLCASACAQGAVTMELGEEKGVQRRHPLLRRLAVPDAVREPRPRRSQQVVDPGAGVGELARGTAEERIGAAGAEADAEHVERPGVLNPHRPGHRTGDAGALGRPGRTAARADRQGPAEVERELHALGQEPLAAREASRAGDREGPVDPHIGRERRMR